MTLETAYLALGSNLGDRRALIESAIAHLDRLPETRVIARSRLIETDPVGPPGQARYLNAAVGVETSLSPRGLLERCLEIEASHGRTRRPGERWGPRLLDIDLLLFGDLVIDEPGLCVPHPRLHERRFVLEPLAGIAPDRVHPVLRRRIQSLLDRLESEPSADAAAECGSAAGVSLLHEDGS